VVEHPQASTLARVPAGLGSGAGGLLSSLVKSAKIKEKRSTGAFFCSSASGNSIYESQSVSFQPFAFP